jgi:glyceraldehyde 3-phosphate dehydrogenase
MRIGINGFGRIGKTFFRALLERHADLEVVAINDLMAPADLLHALVYDSTYGRFGGDAQVGGKGLQVAGRDIACFAEKEPGQIPWNEAGADIVVDCTGRFTDGEQARAHLANKRARKVIISAPAKNEDATLVMGVNHESYDRSRHHVISNASCTTNALACVVRPLIDAFGWKHGLMSTTHAYTNDQNVLDGPHKDPRRARAAGINIVPTSSGAAKALYLAVPETKGTFDGFALRVPTATVSLLTLTALFEKAADKTAVHEALKAAASKPALRGLLHVTDLPLVSSDYRRSAYSAVVDSGLTQVVGPLVQICAWYDNEWGYACRLGDLAAYLAHAG